MEVPSSALSSNGFFKLSYLPSKPNRRLTIKRTQHQFTLPISKVSYFRASSLLRVSARFGETSRRRNSLRKKIIGDENFRISSDPEGTKPQKGHNDFNRSDDLVGVSNIDRVSQDSNLLVELEDWIVRYKKETEYWGIGSNPIFTIYQDSVGNVEKVEVDENEILSRRSESARSRIVYARELAEKLENGENAIHKDSSLVKFVSSSSSSKEEEEFRLVSSIEKAVRRIDLIPKLPAIGKGLLCGYIGLWLLKTVVVAYRKESDEVEECTELEKEMMRRKMKAWKEKETVEKGFVEVLDEPLGSLEKPKLDRKELMSSISKAKGGLEKKPELLSSSEVESGEVMGFDDKIDEIKAMARRAREIEAGIELNENGKAGLDKETGEDDEDRIMRLHNSLAAPMVNGATLDADCSNREMAASHSVSDAVPLVPTVQSSNVSQDKSSTMKSSSGRKSRVIRSVKEAKEVLSRRNDGKELITQTTGQVNDEIFPEKSDETLKYSEGGSRVNGRGKEGNNRSSSSGTEDTVKEQLSEKANWMEKNYDEIEAVVEKMRAGFRDNYMAAREKDTKEAGSIAEIAELYRKEDNDELEWMKDEKLRDIVFLVRDNELAGRDPFHLINDQDKATFLQGLEKKVERENEKLSHLHHWIHSNIENIDYGVDGISVYDPPEKVIPRWKGPLLEKSPEFLDNYHQQREALFSGKAASLSPVETTEEESSLKESSSSSEWNAFSTLTEPKIVVEGSDGSVRAGKKWGKEYWQHTKKWSSGFLELYNAETDPEVKAVMREMGKDLDRWITEDEIKDAAEIMEKLPERNKKFMEKKLEKLKREMELFGPQAVVSKYREYAEDKEEDYLWWLDLPHVLCLEMYTVDEKEDEEVGFYTLEMATDLELEPKPHHVIAFEHAGDARNLCYIIQAHLDMLRTGNVFIVPRPPKDAFREAKANGYGVTVIRKGEVKMNIDENLEEVEERICEIGSKMYHDKMMGDRSVDISSLMKGVFNLKTKPNGGGRRKRSKLASPKSKQEK